MQTSSFSTVIRAPRTCAFLVAEIFSPVVSEKIPILGHRNVELAVISRASIS
jgi:hypothetical protein